MPSGRFIVTATHLNLREEAGTEARILAVLSRGDQADWASDSDVPGWWNVTAAASGQAGCVARQYLAAQSGAAWRPEAIANELLWDRTLALEGKVAYLLGAKHSASGRIDCSGWASELTWSAFDAVNRAADPDIAFHHPDYRLFDTHSDGIVSGIEGRTGFALHGDKMVPAALSPGMLIGCNFGDYNWEHGVPRRVYGIDHIVQVMRDPASGTKYITQSSSSGHGVNKQPLDAWYTERVRGGMVAKNHLHAVDPLLLLDRNTAYAVRSTARTEQPLPAPSPATPVPAPAVLPVAAFGGRSFYIYSAAQLLAQYGSITNAVDELKRCKADAIWVRIHGRGYVGEAKGASFTPLDNLIAAARAHGIAVAGWGWCQGEDPAADAALASQAIARFKVDAYVADIEQGVNGANWTGEEVAAFADAFRAKYPIMPFALTSHGFIDWHSPEIFDKAAGRFDYVNPQAYWFDTAPSAKMLSAANLAQAQYPLADPASYARLCATVWGKRYKRPVIIAGQICPDDDFPAEDALAKITAFLASYKRPDGVIGEAYWHFGAATRQIRDALAQS